MWLMENGGPVIRYRTATELMTPDKTPDIKRLQDDLLKSAQVKTWLKNFEPPFLLNQKLMRQVEFTRASTEIHSSKDTALENVLGKLTDFGLKKGMPELDSRVDLYLHWLKETSAEYQEHFFVIWMRHEVADFLARAGYIDESEVLKLIRTRLDMVYDFARRGDYNIYVDPKNFKKMPASFAGRPLINPELTRGQIRLPLSYDFIGWACLQNKGSKEVRAQANTVVDYILDEKYQEFPWGYGIMFDEESRSFRAMGWSVHIPGFSKAVSGNLESMLRVFRLEQLAHFEAARRHPWIKSNLEHLEQFKTADGTYLFPRDYLPEKPAAYWVMGGKMALEDSPRNKKAIEIESTFRMAKIRKSFGADLQ